MLFSSLTFLTGFLPLFFVIYYLLPVPAKNPFLFFASLVFYGWQMPSLLLLLLAEIAIGYFSGRLMERTEGKGRKRVFILTVVLIVGLLVWFKYANFLASIVQSLGADFVWKEVILPLGISFYTFQILSYVADVYMKKQEALHSFLLFGTYVAMFPQLVAGPIVRYQTIASDLKSRTVNKEDLKRGSGRFVCGLAKKVLIANQLSAFCAAYQECAAPSLTYTWCYALCTFLYVYYDFSGYSDMAIGLGTLMGFHFPENFNYPMMAGTFTDFWHRWHISLTSWFRDYVYIPLGGSRKGTWKTLRNLLIVWLLTGLWHGGAWKYVLWGLLFFVLLSLEKFVFPEKMKRSKVYTVIVWAGILISFLLFYDADLSAFGSDVQRMFGFGALHLWDHQSLYAIRSAAVVIILALAGSFPWARNIWNRLVETKAGNRMGLIVMGFILVLCIAWLASASWNPFLYFQF